MRLRTPRARLSLSRSRPRPQCCTLSRYPTVRRSCRFAYRRLGHFRMWLERVQGLDSIPAADLNVISRTLAVYAPPHPPERIRQVCVTINLPQFVSI